MHRLSARDCLRARINGALCLRTANESVRRHRQYRWSIETVIGDTARLIVENTVVVEIKSVLHIRTCLHSAMLTYLRITGLRVGLMLNFNQECAERWDKALGLVGDDARTKKRFLRASVSPWLPPWLTSVDSVKYRPMRSIRLLVVVVVAGLRWSLYPRSRGPPLIPGLYSGMRWRNVGPARGGRSIAAEGSDARPNEYWFGATGGGAWKSTDGGTTWNPMTDGKITMSSIGSRRHLSVESRRRLHRRRRIGHPRQHHDGRRRLQDDRRRQDVGPRSA